MQKYRVSYKGTFYQSILAIAISTLLSVQGYGGLTGGPKGAGSQQAAQSCPPNVEQLQKILRDIDQEIETMRAKLSASQAKVTEAEWDCDDIARASDGAAKIVQDEIGACSKVVKNASLNMSMDAQNIRQRLLELNKNKEEVDKRIAGRNCAEIQNHSEKSHKRLQELYREAGKENFMGSSAAVAAHNTGVFAGGNSNNLGTLGQTADATPTWPKPPIGVVNKPSNGEATFGDGGVSPTNAPVPFDRYLKGNPEKPVTIKPPGGDVVYEPTFDSNKTAQKGPDYDENGNPLPPWPVAPPSKTAQTHEGEFDPARPEKEPFALDKTAQKGPDYDENGNPLPPWPIAPPKTAGLVGTQGGCKTGQIIGSDGQCRGGSPVPNLTAAAQEEAQNLGIEPQRQPSSSEGTIQTAGMRDDIAAIKAGRVPVKTIIPGALIQKQLQKAK